MTHRRRFIAGAVCPRCGVQDRIHVFEVDGDTRRECVSCGFGDSMGEADATTLPEGRLDSPPRKPLPEGAQAVRILTPDDSTERKG